MPDRGCITTFSGTIFNLIDPRPEMIVLDDIAHHLSMVCRWAGATKEFFSVAQHSVLVSKIVPDHLQRWALLHDAAEAYIGDITRPLKAMLSDVGVIERRIMHEIAQAFELGWPEPADLAQYDDQIQKLEAVLFIRHDGRFHDRSGDVCDLADLRPEQHIPSFYLTPCSPIDAKAMFLARYRQLSR